MTDFEATMVTAIVGFGTGFAIEYGRLEARETYRFAAVLLAIFISIMLWTGNVWEFLVITVPATTMHLLARWLFGPLKKE